MHHIKLRRTAVELKRTAVALAISAALLMTGPASQISRADDREVFAATALSVGGPQTAAVAGRITFAIEKWSNADDTQALTEALKNDGAKGMLKTLSKLHEVGTISSPGTLGYPLRYAAQDPTSDGGRRIVFATDRPISFAESWEQSLTLDYPFTFVELHVDKDGHGEGKLTPAVKVIPAGGLIVLEDWATAPIHLSDVREEH